MRMHSRIIWGLFAVIWVLFFAYNWSHAIWTDSNFYYRPGSKVQLTSEEEASLVDILKQRMRAKMTAKVFAEGGAPNYSEEKDINPFCVDDSGILGYCDTVRSSATANSPYYDWGSLSPLDQTSETVTEDATYKDIVRGTGDTSYACQNLEFDYAWINCTTPGPGLTHYTSMPVKDITGFQTNTRYMNCGGTWKYMYQYRKGCYRPASNYYTYTAVISTDTSYVSPAEYKEVTDSRAAFSAAIASVAASGFAGGVNYDEWTNINYYLTYGIPIPSTGTLGGTGDVGNTGSTTTINVNVQFPDYTIQVPTSGDWDVWAATDPTSSIITNIIDDRVAQASATFAGLRSFVEQFRVDDSVYDPCVSSGCFSLMGHPLACMSINDVPQYPQFIAFMTWFVRVMCALTALSILLV